MTCQNVVQQYGGCSHVHYVIFDFHGYASALSRHLQELAADLAKFFSLVIT